MKTAESSDARLSDGDLIAKVKRLVASEREATTELLRSLMEFDARRLYFGEGYPSLFAYCTRVLHYAEHAALNRIEVARAARRLPVLLEHIAQGTLHITGARMLAPHLRDTNASALLAAARHKSKREIEELIAGLKPRADVAPIIRRLPTAKAASPAEPVEIVGANQSPAPLAASRPAPVPPSHPAPVVTRATARALVTPLAPERFKVQFTMTRETRDKLRQAQDLMRHVIPNGDPAVIFDRALTALLEHVQRKRFAATSKPLPARPSDVHARHIPAAVRRTVWERDAGCCAFVGTQGRCKERGFLELHHVVPFAVGGAATVENIELRCRAHNAYEASLFVDEEEVSFLGIAPETSLGATASFLRTRPGASLDLFHRERNRDSCLHLSVRPLHLERATDAVACRVLLERQRDHRVSSRGPWIRRSENPSGVARLDSNGSADNGRGVRQPPLRNTKRALKQAVIERLRESHSDGIAGAGARCGDLPRRGIERCLLGRPGSERMAVLRCEPLAAAIEPAIADDERVPPSGDQGSPASWVRRTRCRTAAYSPGRLCRLDGPRARLPNGPLRAAEP